METTVSINIPLQEFQTVITDIVNSCLKNQPHLYSSKNEPPDILDIHGAADLTGFKVSTLYTKVNKRTIPYRKVKGTKKLFFSRKELTEWLQDGKKETQAQMEQRATDYFIKNK